MSLGILSKDPQEIRVFTMDWTAHITGDTIATSSWTVPAGITEVSSSIATSKLKTSIKLSGGTAGSSYLCTNTITLTTSGETLEKSGTVAVRQR